MNLMHRLASLLPLQTKASRVGKLLRPDYQTAWVGLGGPVWSSRSLAKLTREGFCQNVIAYRCITTVAECAAATPFVLFKGDKRMTTHPLLDILKTPNPLQSGLSLMEAFYGHYQIAGNAYMELVENAANEVGELYVLRPDRMSIIAGAGGWPARYEYKLGSKKHSFPVDQKTGLSDILHLKTFNPQDDHYGLSSLEPAAMSIDIHNAAGGWNKALMDNAARPSGALVFEPAEGNPGTLSDEQFTRLKQELEENYQGSINAGRPFLLEGGLKWQQMGLTPHDMEFIETKNVAAREIALAFGVPPMILGIPGDNTYANYAEANRALWRLTLLPLLEQMCAGLNNWLVPRFGRDLRLDYDRDAIPALAHERDALWQRLGETEFLTDNEKRKMMGFEPIKGGDQLLSPLAHPQMPRGECVAMPLSIDNIQTDGDALKKKALPLSEAERIEQEPLVKIWRTVRDNRTRVSHVAAHGQVRFMGEPFIVGGVELSGPRDPDGPPGETYNCRCLVEVVPLSQLPPDLLSQIKDRLTDEQRRFLEPGFGGIRVAQNTSQIPVPPPKPTPPPKITGAKLIPKAKRILSEILKAAGEKSAVVSSSIRTPADQARIMYDNIVRLGVAKQMGLYKAPGRQVIQVYVKNQSKPKNTVIKLMEAEIIKIGPIKVSKHLDTSGLTFDVDPFSISNGAAFVKAAKAHPEVLKVLTPSNNDPAYHIEISP